VPNPLVAVGQPRCTPHVRMRAWVGTVALTFLLAAHTCCAALLPPAVRAGEGAAVVVAVVVPGVAVAAVAAMRAVLRLIGDSQPHGVLRGSNEVRFD
jgi:uncharacterized membrane protein